MRKFSKKKPRKRPGRSSQNSTASTTFGLSQLAPELLEIVIKQLDTNDLKNACLVSRTWRSVASQYLFQNISFLPTRRGIKEWKLIIKHKTNFPRAATIYTAPVPYYKNWHPEVEEDEFKLMEKWKPKPNTKKYADFYQAFTDLATFPNLNSAHLHFTPACVDNDFDYVDEGVEKPMLRTELWELFFEALERRHDSPGCSIVKTLTISNLQNMPHPGCTNSGLFKTVMQDIEHLHLSIVQESYDEADDDILQTEKRTFIPYLQGHWLSPISHQLKSLTLYFSRPWGSFPTQFDPPSALTHLEFSQLETLTLGNYLVAYDDSIDWILRQKSIRSLRLHNCMIPSYLVFEVESMLLCDIDPQYWNRLPIYRYADDWRWYDYMSTWETVFDRIRESLPQLIDFRFHIDPNHAKYCYNWTEVTFNTPERLTTFLSGRRYTNFDMSRNVNPWLDIADDGLMGHLVPRGPEMPAVNIPVNRHEDTKEGDGRALNDLLHTLHERRRGRC